MRRPLGTELGAEDRSLARRWAIVIPSFYSIIVTVVIVAALASSTASKVTVVASPEPNVLLQDQSGTRPERRLPYGSLPNVAAACTVPQPCREQDLARR